MSRIALSGNTSGNGVFTIVSPNGNTDRILTLPDAAGSVITTGSTAAVTQGMLASGLAGNGPAFSAFRNSPQSIGSSTFTKVQLNNENFDTANCFDSTTNYRFTPNVAGYYHIAANLYFYNTTLVNAGVSIYKNGSNYAWGSYISAVSGVGEVLGTASQIIYLNGSTDYIEIYGYCSFASGTAFMAGSNANLCTASGALVRAA